MFLYCFVGFINYRVKRAAWLGFVGDWCKRVQRQQFAIILVIALRLVLQGIVVCFFGVMINIVSGGKFVIRARARRVFSGGTGGEEDDAQRVYKNDSLIFPTQP